MWSLAEQHYHNTVIVWSLYMEVYLNPDGSPQLIHDLPFGQHCCRLTTQLQNICCQQCDSVQGQSLLCIHTQTNTKMWFVLNVLDYQLSCAEASVLALKVIFSSQITARLSSNSHQHLAKIIFPLLAMCVLCI